MKADPKYSAGARAERKACLAYVRRRHARAKEMSERIRTDVLVPVRAELREIEAWVLSRQKRYDKKPGGLGRK